MTSANDKKFENMFLDKFVKFQKSTSDEKWRMMIDVLVLANQTEAELAKLKEAYGVVREAMKMITIQYTSTEYLVECNDELDGQTAIEAWDSLISDTREALAKAEEGLK